MRLNGTRAVAAGPPAFGMGPAGIGTPDSMLILSSQTMGSSTAPLDGDITLPGTRLAPRASGTSGATGGSVISGLPTVPDLAAQRDSRDTPRISVEAASVPAVSAAPALAAVSEAVVEVSAAVVEVSAGAEDSMAVVAGSTAAAEDTAAEEEDTGNRQRRPQRDFAGRRVVAVVLFICRGGRI